MRPDANEAVSSGSKTNRTKGEIFEIRRIFKDGGSGRASSMGIHGMPPGLRATRSSERGRKRKHAENGEGGKGGVQHFQPKTTKE